MMELSFVNMTLLRNQELLRLFADRILNLLQLQEEDLKEAFQLCPALTCKV